MTTPDRPPQTPATAEPLLPVSVGTYTYLWAAAGIMAGLVGVVLVVAVQVVGRFDCGGPVVETRDTMRRLHGDLSLFAAKRGGAHPASAADWGEAAPFLRDGRPPRDGWGRPLLYVLTVDGPVLLSLGADGRLGGVDAAADLIAPGWADDDPARSVVHVLE